MYYKSFCCLVRHSNTLLMLSLPVDVICELILPHLTVRDLQALGVAYGDKRHKTWLQSVWEHVKMIDLKLCSEYRNIGCVITFVSRHFPSLSYLNAPIRLDDNMLIQLAHGCNQLEELYLFEGYTDTGVTALAQQCHQLHTIKLSSHHITNNAIRALCDHCPLLIHIDLSNCDQLTGASLVAIANSYPKLQSINIKECSVSDDTFRLFAAQCRQLKSVAFGGRFEPQITNYSLIALWTTNPHLQKIDLIWNLRIFPSSIISLVQRCPQLCDLRITYDHRAEDGDVIAVVEHCPQLTYIALEFGDISDDVLIALGQHCHELKSINVARCFGISDEGMVALAIGCPLLEEVTVSDTNITDAGVIAVAEHCSQLSVLIIKECHGVSDTSLYALGQYCHQLTSIDISDNCNITGRGRAALAAGCPFLRETFARDTRNFGCCIQ